jgi:hypothetical protein
MKTAYFLFRSLLFLTLIVVSSVALSSCSKKIEFNNSSIVPAARGHVNVKKDKNNNYNIKLELSYLAEPDRLDPPKQFYVVWLSSNANETPMNMGQIVGTSKLHVSFEGVSASKPKRIFVTAEDQASAQYPSSFIVLETTRF